MRKPESFFSIWLGNVVFVGIIISGLAWWYASHMYNVGMDVTLDRFIPAVFVTILLVGSFFAWINWLVTKGKF